VEDSSNLHAIVSVRVASILGGDQQTVMLLTVLPQLRRIVMAVA
jgi:hypothetical protein